MTSVPLRAVLLLGCLGVAAGCSRRNESTAGLPRDPESELVVAKVGSEEITARDVTDRIRERASASAVDAYLQNPDVKQITLDSILDEMVWAEAAKEKGLDRDPVLHRRVEAFRLGLLAQKYVAEVLQPKARPSEESVRAYFEQHRSEFESRERVAARQILVGSQGHAEALLRRIQSGEDFAVLASQESLDPATRALGGSIGYVMRGIPNPSLAGVQGGEEILFSLSPGQVSTAVPGSDGFRIFKVERRDPPGSRTLEEVRADIERVLAKNSFREVYSAELYDLRKKYDAKINQENFEKYSGSSNDPERLFKQAMESTDPVMKMEFLRRIVFDFPDNPRAAEAQFLVGLAAAGTKDYPVADKAFLRLERNYADSPFVPMARWVRDHMREPDFSAATSEDVRRMMGGAP